MIKKILSTKIIYLFPLLCVLCNVSNINAKEIKHFDILIVGGCVLDGTGNPWFYADIGIRHCKIVRVGRLKDIGRADRVINAYGLMITPGFIDIHSHAFDKLRPGGGPLPNEKKRRAAPNFVTQGVTTVVTNQDGESGWPIVKQIKKLESRGIGPNTILLIGHGKIRHLVMKNDYKRFATKKEIQKMCQLVRQGMKEGAWGLSAGLEYVPGIWSNTDELVELVKEIVPYGGVYIVHERSAGKDPMWYFPSQHSPLQPDLFQATSETIKIAEKTGVTAVTTHIKVRGAGVWGASQAIVNLIKTARTRGVDIWADNYPYNTTGSDGRMTLIPSWIKGNKHKEALQLVLSNPEKAAGLRRDIVQEIERRGGAENIIIMDYPDKSYIGKSLAQLAKIRDISAVEMGIVLALEGYPDHRGGVRLRGFSLSEIDVETYVAQEWVATCSDAGIALPGDGPVHARFYGAFPRKIKHYALKRNVISVADAVRSMTSLPAQILSLKDRGLIREGYIADLVIINPKTIRDTATFFEPHQYAKGIEYVLVNGVFVIDGAKLTWKLPGRIITLKQK